MLTRRNKEKLIFLILGIFVGIAISAIVAYFSIIAGITQESIVKITNIFPAEAAPPKTPQTKAIIPKDTITEQAEPQKDTSPQKKDIVKSDVKIASEILPILWVSDSGESVITIKKEIQVEQWSSPMNFVGYKLTPTLLIIYGLDLKNIDLQYKEDNIHLIVGEKELILRETDGFVRFPNSFFR